MPLVDMPLEQLKNYQGINPRPADHDAYWERGLAQMHAMDAKVELIASDFKTPFAECFDLYFTGVGGARVYAKYVRPTNVTEPHPGIVQFHGYSGANWQWASLLSYAAMGYSIVAMDCRGQGGRSEDVGGVKGTTLRGHFIRGLEGDPDNLLMRHIFLDTAQLAGILMDMPEVDAGRVGAHGGSQGGGLTLACAALEPRIKLAAATFPFLSDYRRVWNMDLAKGAYDELKYFFRCFDPTHAREDHWFTQLGYIDIQHLASRIKAQVLMGVGLMDTICPPSTQFAAYNKIQSQKDLVIYPDFGHEELLGFADNVFQLMTGL